MASMITTEHPIPDKDGLRRFGLLFAGILALLFGLIIPCIRFGMEGLPLLVNNRNPHWPWWAAAVIAALALALPASLKWLYRPWMKFADVAQWVNSRLILFVLYYFIILPIGLLRRLLGKDSMQRKFDRRLASYRTVLGAADHNDMEKPY
jgi:hypothetical protein